MSSTSKFLENAADLAGKIAASTPPPFNILAGIVAVSAKAGSAIAAAGDDPVIEITRLLDRHPGVQKVREQWAAFIDANWPLAQRKTDPSALGKPDPYED